MSHLLGIAFWSVLQGAGYQEQFLFIAISRGKSLRSRADEVCMRGFGLHIGVQVESANSQNPAKGSCTVEMQPTLPGQGETPKSQWGLLNIRGGVCGGLLFRGGDYS